MRGGETAGPGIGDKMRGAWGRETVRPGWEESGDGAMICEGLSLAWSEHVAIFLAWLSRKR
jgi:hypothetical protein